MTTIHNFVLKIETRWAARLINESWDVYNKTFDSLSKSSDKKEKKREKTRYRWQLKRLRAEPHPVSEPCISQGHVIRGLCDIVSRRPSVEFIILLDLVAMCTLIIEI